MFLLIFISLHFLGKITHGNIGKHVSYLKKWNVRDVIILRRCQILKLVFLKNVLLLLMAFQLRKNVLLIIIINIPNTYTRTNYFASIRAKWNPGNGVVRQQLHRVVSFVHRKLLGHDDIELFCFDEHGNEHGTCVSDAGFLKKVLKPNENTTFQLRTDKTISDNNSIQLMIIYFVYICNYVYAVAPNSTMTNYK